MSRVYAFFLSFLQNSFSEIRLAPLEILDVLQILFHAHIGPTMHPIRVIDI